MSSRRVQCMLCPFGCVLEEGERGRCGVRINRDGELLSLVYGRPVAVHIDPVEKKPLYHFHPQAAVLSIATAGCNLRCLNCQNWEISQALPEDVPPLDMIPAEVVRMAEEYSCEAVAYTYTEPVVFYEYMEDTASLARDAGIGNIIVTAGYISEGPLRQLIPLIDAANVDLKSIRNDFYRNVCGGELAPVKRSIEILAESDCWIEITNLVIPTLNDTDEEIEELCRWILDTLGPDVPLHFSRFFPMYRMNDLPPTPLETLVSARELARDVGIRYVYVGNAVTERGSCTFCPDCGELLISREGYSVTLENLEGGSCGNCSGSLPGVWN
jgi:pyruvate formate lyase activating enzyme